MVDTFKDAGNTAFRAGNFAEALVQYEAAINADPSNHVCYLNRAVTLLRLGRPLEAVADADSALAIKADYSKAYNTKGAALQQLGRTPDAIAVYRKGLEKDPTHDLLLQNLRKAEDSLRQAAAPDSNRGAGRNGTGSSANVYSASAAPSSSAAGPSSSGGRAAHGVVPLWPRPLLARGILAARIYITVSVLVSLVLSLLPLAWARYASDRLYFTMLLVAAATHLADVIGRYGMPNTSQAYIARVSADSSFHLIFLPVILYIAGVPYFSGEVAAIDFDVLHVGEWLHSSVGARVPWVSSTLATVAQKSLPILTRTDAAALAGLSSRGKWEAANKALLMANAFAEVALMFQLLTRIFSPTQSLLVALFCMYTLLQFRYLTSDTMRTVFGALDGRARVITAHRMCPGVLAKGYDSLATWLHAQVAPPPPPAGGAPGGGGGLGGAIGNALRGCAVM